MSYKIKNKSDPFLFVKQLGIIELAIASEFDAFGR